MEAIGEIVKDDGKLGTLYVTLVLATPGEELSQETRVYQKCARVERIKICLFQTNPELLKVQQEITLLLYRYLKAKYKDADTAYQRLNQLLRSAFTFIVLRNPIQINPPINNETSICWYSSPWSY